MLRFRPVEPLVKLSENQREIARKILLGDWGDFPRENDDETASETGVETATKAGLFPTQETPSRRSENVDAKPIKFRLFCTVEIEIEPDVLNDQYNVVARYDGSIIAESSIPDEAVREFAQILYDVTSRFDAIAEHAATLEADDDQAEVQAEGGAS